MEDEMKRDIDECMEALREEREKGCANTPRMAAAFAAGYLQREYPKLTELLDLIIDCKE